MKDKFSSSKLYIVIILAVCIGLFLGLKSKGIYAPGTKLELSDIARVACDEYGNSYILNNAGYQLIRLDSSGKIDLIIEGRSKNDNRFMRGMHVASDSDGNIYIHNQITSKEAISWTGQENIKVFDKNGKYLRTYCDTVYPSPVITNAIIGLQNIDGRVYMISTDEDYITLRDVLYGDVQVFQYRNIEKLVSGAVYSKDAKSMYVCTKDGRILKLKQDGAGLVYGITKEDQSACMLYDISIDSKGMIYVCDILGSRVLRLDGNYLTPYFQPNRVVYNMDAESNIIYNNTYSIVRVENNRYMGYSSLEFNRQLEVCHIAISFAILVILFAMLALLVHIVDSIIRSPSWKVRTTAAFSVIIIIVTACFCTLMSQQFRQVLMDDMVEKELTAGKLINEMIEPEWFRSLDSVTDYYSENYIKIKDVVDKILLKDGIIPGDMYTVMYSRESDGSIIERYSLDETKGCNYPYIWADGDDEAYVYETGEDIVFDLASDSEGEWQCIYTPVLDNKGNTIGIIEVGTDVTSFNNIIREKVVGLAISIFALAVVFVLIILEIIEYMDGKKKLAINMGAAYRLPLKMYRLIVFIIFFATNITTPFLSLYALGLSESYQAAWGIPGELLAAVPISTEVLFGAIFSMLGGQIIKRLGYRRAGIIGAALFTAGLLIRCTVPDLIILTLGNAIQGSGWGIVLLIVNSRIASEPDEELAEKGFTDYNIALQNGLNSGIVFGGFLLTFASYNMILIVAVILSVILLYYVFMYIKTEVTDSADEGSHTGAAAYIRFILTPRVLLYFGLIVIPVIAASYYLNFLYPIIAEQMGMADNTIGYSYLFNGIVIICFGNIIVNFMSKFFNRKLLLMISSIIYLLTFVMVGWFESIPALIVSLVLIAVADSFGYVAQSTFYTELKETEIFGYENAMGVYSLFENLAQTAGAYIFGYILTVGVKQGMTTFGLVIGIAGILFAVLISIINKVSASNIGAETEDANS